MEFLLTIQTLIWLFPIMFIIHDFEEIIMVEKWLHNNQTNLYKRLPTKIADRIVKQFSMTTAQFAVAVLLIFLLISAATISANIYFYNGIATNLYFFIVITSVFLSMHLRTLGKRFYFALLPLELLHRYLLSSPTAFFYIDRCLWRKSLHGK